MPREHAALMTEMKEAMDRGKLSRCPICQMWMSSADRFDYGTCRDCHEQSAMGSGGLPLRCSNRSWNTADTANLYESFLAVARCLSPGERAYVDWEARRIVVKGVPDAS